MESAPIAINTDVICILASVLIGEGTNGNLFSSGINSRNGPTKSIGTTQNVMRQEEISTNKPAKPGPIKPGTTHAAANIPRALARNASGYMRPMTTYMVTKSIPKAKP